MTDTTTEPSTLDSDDSDDYFGVCPECQKSDGYMNVGRGHWFYCLEHRTRWFVGENLFDSWKHETEADQRAQYDAMDFGTFRDVAPSRPGDRIVDLRELTIQGPTAWTLMCNLAHAYIRSSSEPDEEAFLRALQDLGRGAYRRFCAVEFEPCDDPDCTEAHHEEGCDDDLCQGCEVLEVVPPRASATDELSPET